MFNSTACFLALACGSCLLLTGVSLKSYSANSMVDRAEALTLEKYRSQVIAKDPGFRAAKIQSEAVKWSNLSKDEITDTQIFFSYINSQDMRPTQNPSFQGTSTDVRMMSLGLQKQTEWGPSFSISQNISHTIISNAAPTAIPEPDYYDFFPEFKATVPLWRNFLGVETRSELNRREAQADLRAIQAEIQFSEISAGADIAYYTHFANVENIKIQRELLSRTEKILTWVRGQKQRGLVDTSDLHQAEAAVTLRKIDLANLTKELQVSARQFNDLRWVNSDEVSEVLIEIELDMSKLMNSKNLQLKRRDLLLKLAQLQMQEKEFQGATEHTKPQLDLAFRADWVGRDNEMSQAQSEFRHKNQTLYYVGLQFLMPLDVFKYLKVRDGLGRMSEGQSLMIKSHERAIETAWQNFVDMGGRLHMQITLLRELEQIQKLKSDAERIRFQRGRSTTFQVLSFEQDYITARSRRISAELEARRYITQIDMFK